MFIVFFTKIEHALSLSTLGSKNANPENKETRLTFPADLIIMADQDNFF
jgi:hypothetical protein